MAVATPAGHGGVGMVRLSGPDALAIGRAMAGDGREWIARRVTRAQLKAAGLTADALVTYFKGPASYTGQDMLELSAHGSPVVLAALVERATALGARLAQAGEFTLRAFINGKLDLVQAEAVRDLVDAVSPAQARAAFDQLEGSLSSALADIAGEIRELEVMLEASMDFPEEGYHFIGRDGVQSALARIRDRMARLVQSASRGQMVREGSRVVIAGAPNVGKSSLFNALAGADRAIVSATPGTTRDLVTARLVLGDALVELVDTAGLRSSDDEVEQEGVRRAGQAVDRADVVIIAIDRSRALADADRLVVARAAGARTIVVATKSDLPAAASADAIVRDALAVSALTGTGLGELTARVARTLDRDGTSHEHVLVTNHRHRVLIASALEHIDHAAAAFRASDGALPEEFVAADLQLALRGLEEVTGRRTSEELMHEIFSRFCIGK